MSRSFRTCPTPISPVPAISLRSLSIHACSLPHQNPIGLDRRAGAVAALKCGRSEIPSSGHVGCGCATPSRSITVGRMSWVTAGTCEDGVWPVRRARAGGTVDDAVGSATGGVRGSTMMVRWVVCGRDGRAMQPRQRQLKPPGGSTHITCGAVGSRRTESC